MKTDQSISYRLTRVKEFNRILSLWIEYYNFYTRKLVYHLYDLGYTCEKVANILDVEVSYVKHRYPKGVKHVA